MLGMTMAMLRCVYSTEYGETMERMNGGKCPLVQFRRKQMEAHTALRVSDRGTRHNVVNHCGPVSTLHRQQHHVHLWLTFILYSILSLQGMRRELCGPNAWSQRSETRAQDQSLLQGSRGYGATRSGGLRIVGTRRRLSSLQNTRPLERNRQ